MPRMWVDHLYDRDGVVSKAASVVVVGEWPRGRNRLATVLVQYRSGADPGSPLMVRKMSLNWPAYRALRTRGVETLTVQYLPAHPMIVRPVEVAPDGTLRDLRTGDLHPLIYFAISLFMLLGNGLPLMISCWCCSCVCAPHVVSKLCAGRWPERC